MALTIDDPITEALLQELAAFTGESSLEALATAVRERLERLAIQGADDPLKADIAVIVQRCSSLPELDSRAGDDVIGYDVRGVPSCL